MKEGLRFYSVGSSDSTCRSEYIVRELSVFLIEDCQIPLHAIYSFFFFIIDKYLWNIFY